MTLTRLSRSGSREMATLQAAAGMTEGQRGRASVFDAGLLAVPGVEALHEIQAGRGRQPPIHYWSGRRLIALQHGEASIAMPVSAWFYGPKGRLHPGNFAFLFDMTHFYAVLSTLPAGAGCTTAELSVTVLGEPPRSGTEITGRSRVVYSDERCALAEGLVVGEDGHPFAHSTSRYFLFAPGSVQPSCSDGEPLAEPPLPKTRAVLTASTPHLAPVGPALLRQLSGLEILTAQLTGEIPAAPVDRYVGIQLMSAHDGRVAFSLPVHAGLQQELGTVFGGVIALMAKSAIGAAVQAVAPAGTGFTALDFKVNFLRPCPADGGKLIVTGFLTHRGKRLCIANAEVTYRGRRIAVATGTTSLTPPE